MRKKRVLELRKQCVEAMRNEGVNPLQHPKEFALVFKEAKRIINRKQK